MSKSKPIWIGHAHMKSAGAESFLDASKGAYCQMLVRAESRSDFRTQLLDTMKHYNLKLISLTDCEPLEQRLQDYTVAKEILEAADTIEDGHVIFAAALHTYPL